MTTVADRIGERSNNFDLIRLFAALLVLWSHSYVIGGYPGDEIFSRITGGYDSGGGLAVSTYFVISGFLVTKSATERSAVDYVRARSLRIWPGLVAVVVFTLVVVGPLLTKMSLLDYFEDPTTRDYVWSASVFRMKYLLADTTSNLSAPQINGSLWTLPVECGFYVVVLLCVKLEWISQTTITIALAFIVGAYLYFTRFAGVSWDNQGVNLWNGASLYAVLINGSFFTMGGLFWVFRRRIPLAGAWACLCVVIWFAAARTASAPLIYIFGLPYVVIYLGLGISPLIDLVRKVGDLSYGVYLFAFPVQQVIVSYLGPKMEPTRLSLMATPITLALAFLSWHGIEKRALKYKSSG